MKNEEKEEKSMEKSQEKEDEHKRLGGYPPLRTIMRLAPGPLISQIVNSLYGVIDSMWVAKFIGELGLTALSVAFVIDNTALSFGYFVSTAASTEMSYLFSQKDYDKVNQLAVDLFRICIILGFLIPAVLFPSSKPLFKFLDAGETVIDLAFDYVIPLLSLNIVTCHYHCVCGVLQAEGRTWAYGGAQIASMILNMICWDPLLLWLLKRTIGSSLATEIAMFIPGIVILIILFCGKFAAKPKLSLYLKKFIPETWEAVKTGFSALIMNISVIVPTLVMQKYIAIRANKIGQFDMCIAVFNALCRVYGLSMCIPIALNAAYLPATSYAFGMKNYQRILWLTFHVFWISVAWGLIVTLICCVWPTQISSIWSTHADFKYWSQEMFPLGFYTISLSAVKFVIISFLQVTQQSVKAMITSLVTELISLPIFATIIHFIGEKNSPRKILWAYVANDLFSTTVCISVALPTLIRFFKAARVQTDNDIATLDENKHIEEESDDVAVIPEL